LQLEIVLIGDLLCLIMIFLSCLSFLSFLLSFFFLSLSSVFCLLLFFCIRYVQHFEELVAKGLPKAEAYPKAFAHYEVLLRYRRELDRTALQEAYHFGAKIDFTVKDQE